MKVKWIFMLIFWACCWKSYLYEKFWYLCSNQNICPNAYSRKSGIATGRHSHSKCQFQSVTSINTLNHERRHRCQFIPFVISAGVLPFFDTVSIPSVFWSSDSRTQLWGSSTLSNNWSPAHGRWGFGKHGMCLCQGSLQEQVSEISKRYNTTTGICWIDWLWPFS